MESLTVEPSADHSSQGPSASGGRAAGLFVVLGLLLLLGGTVAYILTTATPSATPGPVGHGSTRPLTTDAFDQILNTGQKLVNDGKYVEAEALYKQVTASHPEAQAVRVEYARLLAAQKRPSEAYEQYKAAISLGPVEPEVQLEAGTAASMSGQLNLAIEHYSAAQTAAPTDYRAPLFLAQTQLKLKRTDEAKANLLMAAKLNPNQAAPAFATLAQVYLSESKFDIALQQIEEARKLDPKSTVYRVIQARALKGVARPQDALDLLIGLDEAQKHEPGVMQVMAECYGLLGRKLDIAKMYAQASDAEPTNGQWAFEAAVAFERAGENKQGLEYAKRAAALDVKGAAAVAERLSK
jgi:predicted Zn-dependent protease